MTVEDIYNPFFARLQDNTVTDDLSDGTNTDLKVALLDASHTKDVANNAVWGDVSANEITNTGANDSGYTAGGQALTNPTLTADAASRNVDFDGDDIEWTSSTIDAGYAVLYNDTPSAGNKTLILNVDFEGTESSNNASFIIEWDTNGIYRVDTNPA